MKIVLMILIAALIAKDTSQLNDPYVMRGIAQGLCLIAGGLWLLQHFSLELFRTYWPVIGYGTALLIASLASSVSQTYVLLQLLSLGAVLLFFIAYYEHQWRQSASLTGTLINTSILLYGLVAALSLVVLFTHPHIAYGSLYIGDVGYENRFRGLFPKAGMLASAAGLTIGLVWFSCFSKSVKAILIGVCAVCLFLTLSRTFWIALVGGVTATYWLYAPSTRKWLMLLCLAIVPALIAQKAFNVEIDLNKAQFARAETFDTLNGRVGLWEQGLRAFEKSPLFGYGYTAGAAGLANLQSGFNGKKQGADAARELGKTTLHSGYLQSLLDSGLLGTFFYLAILMVALYRLYRWDHQRQYSAEFFALVYLAIANLTQNVIYSASVYDSLLFFGVAVFAISLKRPAVHSIVQGLSYPLGPVNRT